MRRFPTERARLKVRNPSGDVQVETADVAETTVELVPLNDSEATRQAIERANVSARGDDVFVVLEGGRGWAISIGSWATGSAKVSIHITCPNGSDLECDTASADVRATGTLGEARIRSASGDLRVDRVEGGASLNTVSGDLLVRSAMSGINLNSVSGDAVLGEIYGDVTAGTVSGDLMVRAAGPGDVGLKAVSGDVVVAMRRGLRVRLDVNSVSGSVGSELDVSDAPMSSVSLPRSPRRAAHPRSSARRGQAALAAAPARRSPPPTLPSRR